MSKISRIIKAKLSDKTDMPEYYQERLDKCAVCPYNSANVENLSIKDKIRISHNLGKPACLICTCGIEDKASDPQEQCPDTPPRWLAKEVKKGTYLELSLTEGIAELSYDKVQEMYILDYGDIGVGKNTRNEITYKKRPTMKNLETYTSCGCTTGTLSGDKLYIEYGNRIVGPINKTVTLSYNEGGKQKITKIQLKGKIQHGL